MNLLKKLAGAVLLVTFGISNSMSAEKEVLILGANQYEEACWHDAVTSEGESWMRHLKSEGLKITTINNYGNIELIKTFDEDFGKHVDYDWNDLKSLSDFFVRKSEKMFDLIINDYGVSYFIHDKTLPSFLKTLKIGGTFLYGPMSTHCSFIFDSNRNIEKGIANINSTNISFSRIGLGIVLFLDDKLDVFDFNFSMHENTPELRKFMLSHIDNWKNDAHSKQVLRDYVNKLFDRMTFENFANFINENCGFNVDIKMENFESDIIQSHVNAILPPDHYGKEWGKGDWIIMQRLD